MATVHTELSAVIDAPPAEVYGIFVDYNNLHPQILPKPYFGNFKVEKGGMGAGTVYRTTVTFMGMGTNYYAIHFSPVITSTAKAHGLLQLLPANRR